VLIDWVQLKLKELTTASQPNVGVIANFNEELRVNGGRLHGDRNGLIGGR
jgi:hypothetical protein